MPAYFESGFSVREPMWHGQGLVLDEYPTDWADARAKAGLTWEPVERPCFVQRSTADMSTEEVQALVDLGATAVVLNGTTHLFVKVPDHKLIVRNDTEMVLGVTSDEFAAIYHGEDHAEQVKGASMEEIIDAFRSADGGLRFETAGAAREGRQVWALLYLDEPYTVPGDDTEHYPFLAVLNNHDGSGACRVVNTQVRVVCWNTFQMALAEGDRTGRQFSFRHVGDVKGRIDEAKAAISGLRTERDDYLALAAELTALQVDDARVDAFLSEFLPSPRENGEVVTDRVHDNVVKARAMFKHIYHDSITTESVRGTGYGLLQASTEYLDHARAYRSQDSYLGRSLLRPEPAKAKALELVRRVAV